MTTARSVLLSALLIAAAVIGSAWWLAQAQPEPQRYQLVNVGRGETQRLDRLTGDLVACRDGGCAKIIAGKEMAAPIGDGDDIPPGFELDTTPAPTR